MHAADFELNVSLPAEARFAETMRELAAHAARYAGGGEKLAAQYGATVETIVRACLNGTSSGEDVVVILRRGAGPVEFLIACEQRFEAKNHNGDITVGWTRERGTQMCRVALEL